MLKTILRKNELRKQICNLLNSVEQMYVKDVGDFVKRLSDIEIDKDHTGFRYILKCDYNSYSKMLVLLQPNAGYGMPTIKDNQYFCHMYLFPNIGPVGQQGLIEFSNIDDHTEFISLVKQYHSICEDEKLAKAKPSII